MNVTFVSLGDEIASSRLRAMIPQQELIKRGHTIGTDIAVYGKHVVPMSYIKKFKYAVYDVCDDHYRDFLSSYYIEHTENAHLVTCNSEVMRDIIMIEAGRHATVIQDPYESEECPPDIGTGFFWFGHQSNIETIKQYAYLKPKVLTGAEWSREKQLQGLAECAAVLLPTGAKRAKSANRLIEAIRNGRFPICGPLPAYKEFSEWVWVGDIQKGVDWFNAQPRDEIIDRIKACQDYIRDRYSPETIGKQWEKVLLSVGCE